MGEWAPSLWMVSSPTPSALLQNKRTPSRPCEFFSHRGRVYVWEGPMSLKWARFICGSMPSKWGRELICSIYSLSVLMNTKRGF